MICREEPRHPWHVPEVRRSFFQPVTPSCPLDIMQNSYKYGLLCTYGKHVAPLKRPLCGGTSPGDTVKTYFVEPLGPTKQMDEETNKCCQETFGSRPSPVRAPASTIFCLSCTLSQHTPRDYRFLMSYSAGNHHI